jgi:lipoate-protein ligase A
MKIWNLVVDDSPQKGSWNMAVDEWLFQSAARDAQTYLRFYAWESPTASLGYTQKAAEVLDLEVCRQQGIDVVRRITGGKMVLHQHEVTYSLSSADSEIFSNSLLESYHRISAALLQGLNRLGLEARLAVSTPPAYSRSDLPCFSHPARDEIEVDGKKLVGSAQKRVGSRFLQHGSILLGENTELSKRISRTRAEYDELNMTSLGKILGRKIAFADVVAPLTQGFSEYFGVELREYGFSSEERAAIEKLQYERYPNLV